MALQRASRITNLLRPSVTNQSVFTRRYAGDHHEPAQNVEGESGKSPKQAQPKISTASPPKEGEASQEVQDHNRDMEKRAERPAEKVKDEDVEKDKVGKGFWGTGGKDGAQGGTS